MTAAILPPPDQPLAADEAGRTLNRALSLADKGYHVFPVRVKVDPVTGANTKAYVTRRADSPTGANWNATRDPELIRSWWGPNGRFRDCMIGVSTEPSGVDLVDLDTHLEADGTRQDGPGEWKRLHPEPYPLPAAVGHSSSGGIHLPYRADPKRPVRTSAGEVAPAVDTRGIGGMFVCWSPWLPKVNELPPTPAIVQERAPHVTPAKRTQIIIDSPATPSDDAAARVLYHRDVIAAAEDGAGTPTASRQAFLAGQYVGAGQVDLDWATAVLLSALDAWTWRKPSDRTKLEYQITKGLADGAREPRQWVDEPQLATVTVLRPATAPVAPPVPRQGPTPLQVELSDPAPAATPQVAPEGVRDDCGDDEDSGHGRRLRLTAASSIVPRRVRWLWDGRWPLGALTLVAGQAGLGKSTIVYDRVARITRGELPGEMHGIPAGALICATEDSWEYTIAPRMIAAGADLEKVWRIDVLDEDIVTGLVLPRDLPAVAASAFEVSAAVLVLDPLTSRVQTGLDTHKDSETRRALEPLADLADRCRLTVVGLMHLNKGGGSDPLTALNGSTAFGGVARSVSFAMFDPDDEERRRKLFGTPKNNLGRSDLPTLAFCTVGVDVTIPGEDEPASVGRIEWLDEVEGSIGDAMERANQDPETRTAIGGAAEWLKDYLTRCGGSADSMAIREAGRGEGHNARTLQRAMKRVGARAESIKDAFPRRTLWTLQSKKGIPLRIDGAEPPSSASVDGRDTTLPSTFNVLTVVTGTTNGDSGASSTCGGGTGPVARPQSAHADDRGSADPVLAAEAPPWAVEDEVAEAAPPPCPCSRAEHLHTKGNWRTDAAGHRWHAFGRGALDDCPQCPSVADADEATEDAPDGAA